MTTLPTAAVVSRGLLEMLRRIPLGPVPVAGAIVFLAGRLVHDVDAKPYFEDEAVGGLIAARPLGEVVRTVVWDRGGSPLHFVLAHAVFTVSPTVEALRWLSIACALATVVVAYALGRELS